MISLLKPQRNPTTNVFAGLTLVFALTLASTGWAAELSCSSTILSVLGPMTDSDGDGLYSKGESVSWSSPFDYDAILSERGMYRNHCEGVWKGLGKPNVECKQFCEGAINTLQEFQKQLNSYYSGIEDKERQSKFQKACQVPVPQQKTRYRDSMSALEGSAAKCEDCADRKFNQAVNLALVSCVKLYQKAYESQLSPAAQAGSSGAAGQ